MRLVKFIALLLLVFAFLGCNLLKQINGAVFVVTQERDNDKLENQTVYISEYRSIRDPITEKLIRVKAAQDNQI